MSIENWRDLLDRHFPWRTDDDSFVIEFIRDESQVEEGKLMAFIRTINWDTYDDGGRTIREMKEQMVSLGRAENLDHLERYEAFIAASKAAFAEVPVSTAFETLMPIDFFFPEVLDQQARTYDEFGKSLSAKSRYGGLS